MKLIEKLRDKYLNWRDGRKYRKLLVQPFDRDQYEADMRHQGLALLMEINDKLEKETNAQE
jgi:hypothetical protein